jgi:hypothetical protein
MAKKKNSELSFADLVAELKASSVTKPVEVDSRQELQYFLIVCEGEKTEPLYFDYYKNLLPRHLVKTIHVVGEGDNTMNIVNRATELKNERINDPILPNFNEIWAVFDKDDFPPANFDNAINAATAEEIKCAYSNQSFELWYVLHFDNLQTAIHRDDYIKILSRRLGFRYQKNDPKVIKFLNEKGDVVRAINWAKNLDNHHTASGNPPSGSCPVTKVYLLVELLRHYCKIS